MPEFIKVESIIDLKEAGQRFGYPYMLKATKGGYDGKGNAVIKSESAIEEAYTSLGGGQVPLMAEKF